MRGLREGDDPDTQDLGRTVHGLLQIVEISGDTVFRSIFSPPCWSYTPNLGSEKVDRPTDYRSIRWKGLE